MATGTVNITEDTWKSVSKVTFDWTATTGGEASKDTVKNYSGEVLRVVCMDTACTGYALAINDSDTVDLLGGQGAALTSGGTDFGTRTSTTGAAQLPLSAVNSKLSLAVTGAGTTGETGQTIVYIR